MNSKRKCKSCGDYYYRLPKHERFRKWCSDKCRERLALKHFKKNRQAQAKTLVKTQKRRAKRKKEEFKKLKSDFKKSDVKTRKIAAKKACHEYIRFRDRGDKCMCCNRPLGKGYHAGHFKESGNNSKIRYHEDNIHAQTNYCNSYKGGDSGDYEKNLRVKIGDKRVNYLLENLGGVVKRTGEDYKDIEVYYKKKLAELKKSEAQEFQVS